MREDLTAVSSIVPNQIPEDVQRSIVRWWKAGHSVAETARAHDVSFAAARNALFRAGVESVMRPEIAQKPERDREIARRVRLSRRLREKGQRAEAETYQEIADDFGISRQRVAQIARTEGAL